MAWRAASQIDGYPTYVFVHALGRQRSIDGDIGLEVFLGPEKGI